MFIYILRRCVRCVCVVRTSPTMKKCVEEIIIPPGCTGLTQPVDVGYNKPFKDCVRDLYEEWMMEPGCDLTRPPRRLDVAKWIVAAEERMGAQILKNAWKRKGLVYFAPPVGLNDVSRDCN